MCAGGRGIVRECGSVMVMLCAGDSENIISSHGSVADRLVHFQA